ncbi:MAG: STAS domain-containing protein [Cyanobacteria bacterium P01_A01_bin.105]
MMKRFESSIRVIRPVGSLTAATVDTFAQELKAALSCDQTGDFMVDMSDIDSIDNAGLVSLMNAFSEANACSKQISLCGVPPFVRIALELAQLDQCFRFVDLAVDRAPALAA